MNGKIERAKIKALLILSASISFFFAVYVPVNAYIRNVQEFPLARFSSLLMASGIFWIAAFVLVFAVLIVTLRVSCRCGVVLTALLFGIMLAAYVQGNLIKVDYGLLDGHSIPWGEMIAVGVFSTLTWAVVVLVTLAACWWLKMKAVEWCGLGAGVFLAYLMLVTVLQSMTLRASPKVLTEFSARNLMTLSSDRNIIVFVVDSLEQSLMDKFLATYPEYRRMLEGFTYYRNTIGKFQNTVRAFPQLVTGYDEREPSQKNEEFKEKAFESSSFLKALHGAGFLLDIYANSGFAPSSRLVDKMGCFGNIVASRQSVTDKVNDYISAVNSAWFSYLPHFLKRYHESFFVSRFGSPDAAPLDSHKVEALVCPDGQDVAFELGAEKRMKVYHFWGVHPPDFSVEVAKSSFDRIVRYLAALRSQGLWEKTAVFIMADHGIVNRPNPTFMCNNGDGPLTVSDVPFSYGNLGEVYTQALSRSKVSVPCVDGERIFFYSRRFDAAGREIKGEPRMVYEGESLSQIEMEGGQTVEGAGRNTWIWTTGRNVRYGLPVPPGLIGKNIVLKIKTSAMVGVKQPSQSVRFSVNGQVAGDREWKWPLHTSQEVVLRASSSINTTDILWVGMEIANPVSPQFLGVNPKDNRELGIHLSRFEFTTGDSSGLVQFSRPQPQDCELLEGFHGAEPTGRWCAKDAKLRLYVPPRLLGKDLAVAFMMKPFVVGQRVPRQRLEISVDGKVVLNRELVSPKAQEVGFNVPATSVKAGYVDLSLHMPDCIAPAEIKINADSRCLSVFLQSCKLELAEDARPLGIRINSCALSQPGKKSLSNFCDSSVCRAITGLDGIESDGSGRWTLGKNAKLEITVPKELTGRNLRMTWRINPFLARGKVERQGLNIQSSGRVLFDKVLQEPVILDIDFRVPAELVVDGRIPLELTLPDAVAPKDVGYNADPRKLAIFLRSCKMEVAK